MPELPEVETIKLGIQEQIVGKTVSSFVPRIGTLRWPIAKDIKSNLPGAKIHAVNRRAKYLLIDTSKGTVIIHLGMSGRFFLCRQDLVLKKHDHFDIVLNEGTILRYNDARRFGSIHYCARPEQHRLLKELGPEPLTNDFNGDYLHHKCKNKKSPVKNVLMNSKVVVGVGNIYANEALFYSGINPMACSNTISLEKLTLLVASVKSILAKAIDCGGTTLKDYANANGDPGLFQQTLATYGRENMNCIKCNSILLGTRISNRSTVYCPICQEM